MSFYLMLTFKILRFMTLKSQKDLKKHSRIYMTDKQNRLHFEHTMHVNARLQKKVYSGVLGIIKIFSIMTTNNHHTQELVSN